MNRLFAVETIIKDWITAPITTMAVWEIKWFPYLVYTDSSQFIVNYLSDAMDEDYVNINNINFIQHSITPIIALGDIIKFLKAIQPFWKNKAEIMLRAAMEYYGRSDSKRTLPFDLLEMTDDNALMLGERAYDYLSNELVDRHITCKSKIRELDDKKIEAFVLNLFDLV